MATTPEEMIKSRELPGPGWAHAEPDAPYINPNDRKVAHICSNGRIRPYPEIFCNLCNQDNQEKVEELSITEMVKMLNDMRDKYEAKN